MNVETENQKTCFVIMPFTVKAGEEERYPNPDHWKDVYKGLIKPAVEMAGLRCERDDEDRGTRVIITNILKKITDTDIILCDLSSFNPNVFFELGWALRTDKPYVLLKDQLTQYVFDMNQLSVFPYHPSFATDKLNSQIEDLSKRIIQTLNDPNRRYSLLPPPSPPTPPPPDQGNVQNEKKDSHILTELKNSHMILHLQFNYGFNFKDILQLLKKSEDHLQFLDDLVDAGNLDNDRANRLRHNFQVDQSFINWFAETRQSVIDG